MANYLVAGEGSPSVGWWRRSFRPNRSCQIERRPPLPYAPVTDPAHPVECVESYITTAIPPMRQANFKAMLVRAGKAQLSGPFGTRIVSAGDLVLFPVGLVCTATPVVPVHIVCAYFNPVFLADQVRWTLRDGMSDRKVAYQQIHRALGGLREFQLDGNQREVFDGQFDRLVCLSQRGSSLGARLIAATQLIWLISDLFDEVRPEPGIDTRTPVIPQPVRREVLAVLDIVQHEYEYAWTTTALANRVSLSESALRRAFRRSMGMSPREYLHRVRLMRFEQLVAGTAMSIGEAARAVGWDSGDYARRVFVRNHGITPREFRAESVGVLSDPCSGGCVQMRA